MPEQKQITIDEYAYDMFIRINNLVVNVKQLQDQLTQANAKIAALEAQIANKTVQ